MDIWQDIATLMIVLMLPIIAVNLYAIRKHLSQINQELITIYTKLNNSKLN